MKEIKRNKKVINLPAVSKSVVEVPKKYFDGIKSLPIEWKSQSLAEVPKDLFIFNTKITNYQNIFVGCQSL